MKRALLLTVVCFVVFPGCGGGGDDGSDSGEVKIINPVGQVELGPVTGASVSIQALDGYTLYNTITDKNGEFVVDTNELKNTIDRYGSNLEYVKVVSIGGIDTDPNDDGNKDQDEAIEVNGKVTGILPLGV